MKIRIQSWLAVKIEYIATRHNKIVYYHDSDIATFCKDEKMAMKRVIISPGPIKHEISVQCYPNVGQTPLTSPKSSTPLIACFVWRLTIIVLDASRTPLVTSDLIVKVTKSEWDEPPRWWVADLFERDCLCAKIHLEIEYLCPIIFLFYQE